MFAESSGLQSRWHHGGHRAWNVFLLRSTGYDRIFSFLLAAIVLVAFVAAGLLAIWLTSGEPRFERVLPNPESGGFLPLDSDGSPDNPVDNFVEPFLPEATTTDISSMLASMPMAVEKSMKIGPGKKGDKRIGPGPPGPNPDPSELGFDRWRIEYQCTDLNHYKRQLAELNIEFGVVSKTSNKITRLKINGNQVVASQSDRSAESHSVYFVPVKRWLRAWDQQIVKSAGIDQSDSIVVHFLSPLQVQQMLAAEKGIAAKESRPVDEIKWMVFKVAGSEGDFRFEPSEVVFRGEQGQ